MPCPDPTTDRIAEIRARANAAIPGPWMWQGNTASDHVFLGTADRGRLYIMGVDAEPTEWVGDWQAGESWPIAEAVKIAGERAINDLEQAGEIRQAGEDVIFISEDPETGEELQTHREPFAELRDRLGNEAIHTDDRYELHTESRPVLRFPSPAEPAEDRNLNGALLDSYKQHAAYEVLGGKTRAEAGLAEDAGRGNSPLYREDLVAIRTPEAEFIAHAREDVEVLLARVAELELREHQVRQVLTSERERLQNPAVTVSYDEAIAAEDLLDKLDRALAGDELAEAVR